MCGCFSVTSRTVYLLMYRILVPLCVFSLSLSLSLCPESEEVTALRAAVEDLDTQIEEQRLTRAP